MDRDSIWLPETREDLQACEGLLGGSSLQGLYISPLVHWEPGRTEWKRASHERPPLLGRFSLLKAFPDGSLLYGPGAGP
jgi:hypothetical protein